MKFFTEPNGLFVIKLPIEWQYANVLTGDDEKSPFSFIPYENPDKVGAFQISCYSVKNKTKALEIQKEDTKNLNFDESRMDGDGFNMHLWYCQVEHNVFMAKYIYDTNKQESELIKNEIIKVKAALSELVLVSKSKRNLAISLDKYEKFQSSLAASFDLKNQAVKNKSFIEFIIIVASQIDAYLRLTIVMNEQLSNGTNEFDLKYFYQGDNDKAIMERKIYSTAKELNIISNSTFDELELLYKKRTAMQLIQ